MNFISFVYIFGAMISTSNLQIAVPDTVLNCCEGDILLLLDSSGSVSSYEFRRLLRFLAELLLPFSLGRGHVRVGLVQVDTDPHVAFGLDAHQSQPDLQTALRDTRQLQGDTNTEAALRLARRLLSGTGAEPEPKEKTDLPKVLLWLTDGVQPGDVGPLMSELKEAGVTVLAVSTGHGEYQVLRRAVTPPIESNLYFVDIDDISIIKEDLREAIIEIIRAERLRVVYLSAHSAVLQWPPVLSAQTGHYELHYKCVRGKEGDAGTNPDTSCDTGKYHRRTIPGVSSRVELTNLRADATYTASLFPRSNQILLSMLSVTFTTLPELLSPAVVSVSDSGPYQIRVSWAPLLPDRVQRYRVEYGAIPSGHVHTVTVNGHQNSTIITQLEPDTQYLVTVSALYSTGKEKAMSVKACTQEVLPGLEDLRLTRLGEESVQVKWRGLSEEALRGYWISWEMKNSRGPLTAPSPSAMHVPRGSVSAQLAHVAPTSRMCVSPVYSNGRGNGLCCTAGEGDW